MCPDLQGAARAGRPGPGGVGLLGDLRPDRCSVPGSGSAHGQNLVEMKQRVSLGGCDVVVEPDPEGGTRAGDQQTALPTGWTGRGSASGEALRPGPAHGRTVATRATTGGRRSRWQRGRNSSALDGWRPDIRQELERPGVGSPHHRYRQVLRQLNSRSWHPCSGRVRPTRLPWWGNTGRRFAVRSRLLRRSRRPSRRRIPEQQRARARHSL